MSVGDLDQWGLGSLRGLTTVGHLRKLTPFYGEGHVLDVRDYRFCKNSDLSFEMLFWLQTSVNLIHGTQTVITTL
jgi:hypothetical protein